MPSEPPTGVTQHHRGVGVVYTRPGKRQPASAPRYGDSGGHPSSAVGETFVQRCSTARYAARLRLPYRVTRAAISGASSNGFTSCCHHTSQRMVRPYTTPASASARSFEPCGGWSTRPVRASRSRASSSPRRASCAGISTRPSYSLVALEHLEALAGVGYRADPHRCLATGLLAGNRALPYCSIYESVYY